ncbi:MAG: enoyl-CoA hydratase/isomerase family protein [Mycobacteriales bacterium]
MPDTPLVLLDRDGALAVLTLNEPEARNPLSPGLIDQLTVHLQQLATDDDVRAVILTGAGRGFCAGADLRRMRSASPLEDREEYDDILVVNRTLWTYPKPTIAAVHGFAMGAGANLMSWCDLVVADEAARIGYPEVRAGVPSATVVPTLMRTLGRKRMFELLLTGDPVTAAEAKGLGLINRVAPEGQAMAGARELAERITSHRPDAIRLTKEIIEVTTDMSYGKSLEYAKDLRVIARLGNDFDVQIAQGGRDSGAKRGLA